VHGREKQMWSQEQGIEGIAQERSDSTWNGSRAKERRTSSLIFGDALEQPGGKPGWVGTARARNGRTPGWGIVIRHKSRDEC
jgi:hypothetical protein